MATTYDKASLVMIPSGYKDDKLYSVKPTDGSGDFTFSRDGAGASPATRVNASGLIEKGRENVLTYSNTFSNAVWVKTGSSVTGGQTGYDGSSDAWALTPSATAGSHRTYHSNPNSSGVVTASVYAKANGYTHMYMYLNTASLDRAAWFDLSNGSVGTQNNKIVDATITDVGGGWYRCDVKQDIAITGLEIYVGDGENISFTGDGTSGILIQDCQVENGLVATDYIETTTAAVSAGLLGDMPRLDYSGGATCPSLLLEPSRVNVLPQSEYYGGSEWTKTNTAVTTNASTSPEGVQNASLVYPTASSSTKWGVMLQEFITGLASANYTNTFYLKSNGWRWVYIIDPSGTKNVWFDLQEGVVGTQEPNATGEIQAMGDGWYKCVVYSHTSPNTYVYAGVFFSDADNSYVCTASGTNGAFVYGAQAELGSYPTSYIPTYGSASTRGKDDVVKPSVSTLIGQTEGTTYIEFEYFGNIAVGSSQYIVPLSISNGAYTSAVYIEIFNNRISGVVFNGTLQASIIKDPLSIGVHKAAIGYANNDVVFYLDGELIGSNTTASIPTTSRIDIGEVGNSTTINQRFDVKQALLFKTRLTNAELAALTA